MQTIRAWLVVLTAWCLLTGVEAQETQTVDAKGAGTAAFDESLAKSLGADERGMRSYVLVILKTGPNKMPPGPERDEMFKGHFANMKRLTEAGKLVQAGPLDGVDGWRGLYVFAVSDLEEARALVATDPVVAKGEMVPELHRYYGSAALMMVPGLHGRVARKPI